MADERSVIFELRVFSGVHESMASELAHVQQACAAAGQNVRAAGGAQKSGLVLADGAVEIASWTYSPGELAR
jgi:hypothetical protein